MASVFGNLGSVYSPVFSFSHTTYNLNLLVQLWKIGIQCSELTRDISGFSFLFLLSLSLLE